MYKDESMLAFCRLLSSANAKGSIFINIYEIPGPIRGKIFNIWELSVCLSHNWNKLDIYGSLLSLKYLLIGGKGQYGLKNTLKEIKFLRFYKEWFYLLHGYNTKVVIYFPPIYRFYCYVHKDFLLSLKWIGTLSDNKKHLFFTESKLAFKFSFSFLSSSACFITF